MHLYVSKSGVKLWPYIQEFSGRTIVVEHGGAAMKDSTDEAIRYCAYGVGGIRPIVVHGGGPEING
jgi:acetylglutamate kinase